MPQKSNVEITKPFRGDLVFMKLMLRGCYGGFFYVQKNVFLRRNFIQKNVWFITVIVQKNV
jgi:hypothetical protein